MPELDSDHRQFLRTPDLGPDIGVGYRLDGETATQRTETQVEKEEESGG